MFATESFDEDRAIQKIFAHTFRASQSNCPRQVDSDRNHANTIPMRSNRLIVRQIHRLRREVALLSKLITELLHRIDLLLLFCGKPLLLLELRLESLVLVLEFLNLSCRAFPKH